MKKNEIFSCPLCSAQVGPHTRGITFHAAGHGLSTEDFWKIVNGVKEAPTCACKEGCDKRVNWKSWHDGYVRYAVGHYDFDKKSKAASDALKVSHWARGKNKLNDSRIAAASERISASLKEKFASGDIRHWSRGQTAKNNSIVWEAAEKRRGKNSRNSHHNWCDEANLLARIAESSLDKFEVSTLDRQALSEEFLSSRISNSKTFLHVKCVRCLSEFDRSIYGVVRGKLHCETCDRSYTSSLEKEIYDYVSSLTQEKIVARHLGPWGEIDIYVPGKKFGVEVNGLYWHSEAVQEDKEYHQKKSNIAASRGIALFHVYEDDWRLRRPIVESMIKHRVGLSKRVGARECLIVELKSYEKKKFFSENHIDGDTKSSAALGLVKDGELLAAASFRAPFHKKWKDYSELARFCTKNGVSVPGALSRLAKHYVLKFQKSLMSYQDTRFGGLSSYQSAGFRLAGETGVSFWWTDTSRRFNRFSTRAQGGRPEQQVSLLKRRLKIWGNKNLLWVYDKPKGGDIAHK